MLLIFIFIVMISLFFFPSLFVYFVQDDFYFLAWSKINTIPEFISFFIPRADNVWYRPLSSPVFFYLCRQVFDLNVIYYHILVLITYGLVMYVLFCWLKQMKFSSLIALLSAIFYGLHQMHTISLSWLATYPFILGPLWLLLWLYFIDKNDLKAIFAYMLGLLSYEIFILAPILLFIKYKPSKYLLNFKILPYIFLSLIIVILRFVVFKTGVNSNLYQITISLKQILLLKFYVFKLLGIPLMITTLPLSLKIIIVGLVGSLMILTIFGWMRYLLIEHRNFTQIKFLTILSVWGLMPFLMMPNHMAPYYLSMSWLGGSALLAIGITSFINKFTNSIKFILLSIILVNYLVIQFIGSRWDYQTHWIFRRAILAQKLVEQKDLLHPVGSEEYFALGANAAYHVYK